jgi:hypothetical protein
VSSKQLGYEDLLCPLIAQACMDVVPTNPHNFNVDNVRTVKVRVVGGEGRKGKGWWWKGKGKVGGEGQGRGRWERKDKKRKGGALGSRRACHHLPHNMHCISAPT